MRVPGVLMAVSFVFCSCGPASDTSPLPSAGANRAPSAQTGLQLFRHGDLKGAEAHLAAALKSAPNDRRILEALGSVYARTDRPRLAEETFRAALALEPASIGARL